MNYKIVLKILGTVLTWEAVLMLPSLFISLVDESYDSTAFITSIVIVSTAAFLLKNINIKGYNMKKREAFASVAISWLAMSLFGSLPYYLSGATPSIVDALFESASGFTTTGASIFTDVEALPRGLLFWRSFTLWMGGMGVLVFTLALAPTLGARSIFIMQAESTGPTPGKLVPKLAETARILYIIYSIMTIITIVLFVSSGMPIFDAFIHAFGTAGTGGFSSNALSIGAYKNPVLEWGTAILMFLFGINFSHYFLIYRGDWKLVVKNEELKIYSITVLVAIILIAFNTMSVYDNSIMDTLRHSVFQVTSIVTTTGFATTDINMWPLFSKSILLLLMLIGSCSGSTSGGVKFLRVIVLFKTVLYEINHTIHPNSIKTIKIDGKTMDNDTVKSVLIFFFIYMGLIFISLLVISLDDFNFTTTFTAVVASIGNIGSGFETISPLGNFSDFSNLSKITMTFLMIIGRLEILPVIALFSPSMWNRQ